MAFEKVARLDELPAEGGLCVIVRGIEVGLFQVDDEVHAMENRCPHAGDPLSEGMLRGCVITCASHGWRFDVRTGHRPDDADGFPIPCFAVRVERDEVSVDLDTQTNRPPRRTPTSG